MFRNRHTRSLTLGAAGVAVVAATAGVAVAVSDNVKAPYAQAGAIVKSNGELLRNKGIKEVKHLGPGDYCITFSDNDFEPSKVLPSVTSLSRGKIVAYSWGAAGNTCDRNKQSARVWATDTDGNVADAWFSIVIN
ncbi:hypothetical protein GCM10015535_41060 [Streptomyces gelaticus]|uniref:Uncharacterized protein n=1 Tax=Streptomyces gelaticus TaxID=285446 RepID=A0ABQ2W180_9ACTN|nr:hypothetical protein [Streptomyces gelaticus]GGV88837.1 hypothetical protein GCM10015535_41060 [Streptomyces gelaticus]